MQKTLSFYKDASIFTKLLAKRIMDLLILMKDIQIYNKEFSLTAIKLLSQILKDSETKHMAEKMLNEYIVYLFQNNESCLDSFVDHMIEYLK